MNALLAAGSLAAALAAGPAVAPADDDLGWLVEPSTAIEYALEATAPPPSGPPEAPTWDGALGAAALDGLFGLYRTVLSSQDDGPCSFTPSCSAFSQQALARFGAVDGLLLTADRLLRDHPLALRFYEKDPETGLLRDPPARYAAEPSP